MPGLNFSLDNFGADGRERLKHITPENVTSQSSTSVPGAEQERWQNHFGLKEPERVKEMAMDMIKTTGLGAEQDVHAGHFGLGYDGKARVRKILETKGVGAEQERYAGHFALDGDTIKRAQARLAQGMKQNQGAEVMS